MGYNIAVVGATGNVGREMMNILAEREFPVDHCYAIASRRSIGTEISFGDKIGNNSLIIIHMHIKTSIMHFIGQFANRNRQFIA